MSIAAQAAVRAFLNGREDLTDGHGGGVLANGAHVEHLRSPAYGAYALVERIQAEGSGGLFAEDDSVTSARMITYVYAGKRELAEQAAAAVATAYSSLSGAPRRSRSSSPLTLSGPCSSSSRPIPASSSVFP
jgi:hypothetical protein